MARQALQAIGAAVPGLCLVVEARHASVGQPVVCGPETGGRVSGSLNNSSIIRTLGEYSSTEQDKTDPL